MQINQQHITVQPGTDITSIWAIPDDFAPGQTDAIILAHGAGNDMNHPFMSYFHEALAEAGLLSIKFNFPYTEQGRKAPDRPAVLMQTWVAIANAVANDDNWRPRRVFLAGKSMGGRIASLAVAQGLPCDGLIFLGYPLHPPKQPEKKTHRSLAGYPLPYPILGRHPGCTVQSRTAEVAVTATGRTIGIKNHRGRRPFLQGSEVAGAGSRGRLCGNDPSDSGLDKPADPR